MSHSSLELRERTVEIVPVERVSLLRSRHFDHGQIVELSEGSNVLSTMVDWVEQCLDLLIVHGDQLHEPPSVLHAEWLQFNFSSRGIYSIVVDIVDDLAVLVFVEKLTLFSVSVRVL